MIAFLALVGTAWPCVNLIVTDGVVAESSADEVLIEPGDGQVSITYRTAYDGDAADLGWIVPIPGPFVSVVDADPKVLDDLREATQPHVQFVSPGPAERGCSCLGAAKGGDGLNVADTGGLDVTVVAEGFTGTYEYTVVSSGNAADLEQWATDNGWAVGPARPAWDHYVEKGEPFVLLKVAPQTADTPEGGRSLPPVRITYGGDVLEYPALMAKYVPVDKQHTIVYIRGDGRAAADGAPWTSTDVGYLEGIEGDDDGLATFEDRLRTIGGANPGYGVVFAGAVDGGGFVTRFETIASASAHTDDARFTVDAADKTSASTIVEIWSSGDSAEAWLLLAPLAGLGAWRRRRG